MMNKSTVIKRDGRCQDVDSEKLLRSLQALAHDLDIDVSVVASKIHASMYPGMTTRELLTLASETSASLATLHPTYDRLAARLVVSELEKTTEASTVKTLKSMYDAGILGCDIHRVVSDFPVEIDAMVCLERDHAFDYFGIKTLMKGYLQKIDGVIVERPQHLMMRVALGIWGSDLERVQETYNLMSQKYFTHATPTLFNAGMKYSQLSSCFLMGMKDDSIDGIFETLRDCAQISKWAGGIGLHIHNVRAKNSSIKGTNGISSGIMPMLRVYNATARYVNQAGRRNGSICIYLEPSHPDVFDILDARKNHGDEESRSRDLFYALWIPDLFMRRVEAGGKWSLFCPNKCPGLSDATGQEYDRLYEQYESEQRYDYQVDAQKLWFAICSAQMETGTPFLLYKDACNAKSNQKHLGTIKSSNLCTEIVEYTAPDEIAVCNLASICLPKFVRENDKTFDFDALHHVTKVVTRNLDRVIDVTYYPVPEAKKSNERHRPIGIGVQGLADTFMMLDMPYDSDAARTLNQDIFETLYHAALEASCERAQELGTYATYQGSPASQGILQYDLWGKSPSGRLPWDFQKLKDMISKHGLRNSLLLAPMPTATTSQIMGNNETFEPYTSNIYVRRTLAGEFIVVNKHLVKDLMAAGLWSEAMKNRIVASNGSVQDISSIPDALKAKYKTAWEIKQKVLIDMAADRGAFICQSQSLNLFVGKPTFSKLSSMHFYSWKKGLKTGMYYLRTQPAADPVKFTIEPCETCSS